MSKITNAQKIFIGIIIILLAIVGFLLWKFKYSNTTVKPTSSQVSSSMQKGTSTLDRNSSELNDLIVMSALGQIEAHRWNPNAVFDGMVRYYQVPASVDKKILETDKLEYEAPGSKDVYGVTINRATKQIISQEVDPAAFATGVEKTDLTKFKVGPIKALLQALDNPDFKAYQEKNKDLYVYEFLEIIGKGARWTVLASASQNGQDGPTFYVDPYTGQGELYQNWIGVYTGQEKLPSDYSSLSQTYEVTVSRGDSLGYMVNVDISGSKLNQHLVGKGYPAFGGIFNIYFTQFNKNIKSSLPDYTVGDQLLSLTKVDATHFRGEFYKVPSLNYVIDFEKAEGK